MSDTTDTEFSVDLPWLQRHGRAYTNAAGEVHITLPERLPHIERDDTVVHVCSEGDRLQNIAVLYYKDRIPNPVDCWEIIAQFQEDPIVDGSMPLSAGQLVMIPSIDYIYEVALADPLHEVPKL